jgi:hypothetical protein
MKSFYTNKNFIHEGNYNETIVKERENQLKTLTIDDIKKYDQITVIRCHGIDTLYDINYEYFKQLMTKELEKKFICYSIETNRHIGNNLYDRCYIHFHELLKTNVEFRFLVDCYNDMVIKYLKYHEYHEYLSKFRSFLINFHDLSIFKNTEYYEKLVKLKEFNENHLLILENHFGEIPDDEFMSKTYKILLGEKIYEKRKIHNFDKEEDVCTSKEEDVCTSKEEDVCINEENIYNLFNNLSNFKFDFKEDFFEEFEEIKNKLLEMYCMLIQ